MTKDEFSEEEFNKWLDREIDDEIKCQQCNEVLLKVFSATAICIKDGYIKCMRCGTKRLCHVSNCKEREKNDTYKPLQT